ncbi:MAG TPA: hypothetical protein VF802_09985 [Candidatus Limnocylindrales bacterium]
MMIIAIVVIGLVGLDVLALRFGVDSRDASLDFDAVDHGLAA